MYSTSQDKNPVRLNQHAEAVCQPIAASSPNSVRSPLLQQQLMMCFEEELSDDEYSDNSGNTGLFHRPTKKKDSDNCKTDAVFVTAASSLDVDGDSEDGGYLQRCGRNDETKPLYGRLSQCEEGITAKSESSGCETPFTPIHCSSDHKADVASGSCNLTINSLNCTNSDDGQLELKRSPKLEHKAVMRVKSMMSIEAPNMPQQQKSNVDELSPGLVATQPPSHATQCGTDPRIAGSWLASNQHCKKGDASELVGVSTINTVTLWRSEDESFGLDVEIMSSPLKVIIAGLKPGGAAERVCLIGLIFITVNISEWILYTLCQKSHFELLCYLTFNGICGLSTGDSVAH